MTIEIITPDKLEYHFQPANGGCFTFRVCAANDVHLALAPAAIAAEPIYEICIGGWCNTKSAIRRNRQRPDVVEVRTPEILNADEFRGFWIGWNHNLIRVGRQGVGDAFMSYEANDLFPVKFIGVCTGWGARGAWVLDDTTPACRGPGYWVKAKDGVVPPYAMEAGIDGSEQTYIARAEHEGDLIPGQLHPSLGACRVVWGGKVHGKKEYEVLCAGSGEWVPAEGVGIPANAVPGGEGAATGEKKDSGVEREPLYIGRLNDEGTIIVGKVQRSHGRCLVANGEQELFKNKYEIYVFS